MADKLSNSLSDAIANICKKVSHTGISVSLTTSPGFIDNLTVSEIPSGYTLIGVKVVTTAGVSFVYSLSNQDSGGVNVRGAASASATFTANVDYFFIKDSSIS